MNNNFQDITNNFASIYLPQEIIINLILSFILGLIISVVYKFTHKGLSYSHDFQTCILKSFERFELLAFNDIQIVVGNVKFTRI